MWSINRGKLRAFVTDVRVWLGEKKNRGGGNGRVSPQISLLRLQSLL